jgi:hypothetical protein
VVAVSFLKFPQALWFAGSCGILEDGKVKPGWDWQGAGVEEWYMRSILMQPAVFWRSQLWQERGGLAQDLHYSFDYDLWLKFAAIQPFPHRIRAQLALYRSHGATKTSSHPERFFVEDRFLREKHAHLWQSATTQKRLARLLRKRETEEFFHEVSRIPSFSQRFHLALQTVNMFPSSLFNPRLDYRLLRALLMPRSDQDLPEMNKNA